jgi:hypothetical protein
MTPEEAIEQMRELDNPTEGYLEPVIGLLQALSDVRTLDGYAEATGFRPSAPYKVGAVWYLRIPARTPDTVKDLFAEGATADEARAKAAAWVREQHA